jgi:hypothetical protein
MLDCSVLHKRLEPPRGFAGKGRGLSEPRPVELHPAQRRWPI